MVDLETENTVDASKTIKPAIKPRAKDHDLTNPFCQSLEHNIVDEACPSNSRRSCTWSSSIRIPSDRYCEERNSAKNSGPPQRRSQKVDCKWIRKESPSTRTCRLHGTVKGHVFRSSTCSRRLHLRPVRIAAFGWQSVRRVVVAPIAGSTPKPVAMFRHPTKTCVGADAFSNGVSAGFWSHHGQT